MSVPIFKLRVWNCTVAGAPKQIAVLSSDVPDSIGGSGTHPFQVYAGPPGTGEGHADTDWRRFVVRGGYFITDIADPDVVVGTDEDLYPYGPHSGVLTGADLAAVTILVAASAVTWIWAKRFTDEGGNNAWRIFYGDDPKNLVATSDASYTPVNGDKWSSFPAFDGTIWPLACVAASDDTNKIFTVRQYQTTDVMLPSSCWGAS